MPLRPDLRTRRGEKYEYAKYNSKAALFPIRPLPDRAKLHDDVNLFGNARITSDRSKIPTVASKHSKPIT